MTRKDSISRTEAINAIHTTLHKFFNTSDDPEPFNDKDELLLNINKAITKSIKKLQPVQLELPSVQAEQWLELKETITELATNDGPGTQQEVCEFLVNLMSKLEKDCR